MGSKLRRGARCFAPYLVRTGTTHGSRELTTRESQPGNEKGGWCKPPLSLELTPQNRKPSRGWDPATPGSQSFSTALRKREQTMCHGVIGNSQSSTRMKLRELAYLSVLRPQSRQWPPTKSHRQIRVYIHSLGETRLLHRRDTGILCRKSVGRKRERSIPPTKNTHITNHAPMDSRSASASDWL